MKFLDEVESIRDESERLNASGVKIIIALGHSGYEMDKMIAREVPLVDLVVGGHSHTFLWNGKEPDLDIPEGRYPTYIEQVGGKTVPVVQAYAFTKYMGRFEVIFNDDGDIVDCHGEPQLLNNTVPIHPDAVELYPKYRLSWESTVVGKSKVVLDGGSKNCRHKECNFGNLVTDSFVYYHASSYEGEYWTDAPIALLNGGTLRNVLIPDPHGGNITYTDLLSAIPFVDNIVSVSLNGSTLLQTLEHGLKSNGETSYGEFLQTSGLFYTVDRTKPPGTRIVDAKARCGLCKVPTYENIVPDKIYRILTRKFVSRGGDGYSILKENAFEEVFEDKLMFDIILWYVKKLSPIMIGEEDRILVLKKQFD
ncbi:hypothetical protein RI129_010246 [Pyrocoelia pectoralis]|uniref:5'-nucleotidase n=1 Tax=Pyrocoelia pectoralis TaxID=417401 RepID=A0AAN7VD35_9COLE